MLGDAIGPPRSRARPGRCQRQCLSRWTRWCCIARRAGWSTTVSARNTCSSTTRSARHWLPARCSSCSTTAGASRPTPRPRGSSGLGALFWLASAFALLLYLVTMVVVLARPDRRNVLVRRDGVRPGRQPVVPGSRSRFPAWAGRWASCAGTMACAAVLTSPRRRRWCTSPACIHDRCREAALRALASGCRPLRWRWRWPAAGCRTAGGGCRQPSSSPAPWRSPSSDACRRVLPHPLAALLWRLCLVVVGTQLLLTLSIAALNPQFASQSQAAAIGAAVWVVFAASMLLMLPFLARTQHVDARVLAAGRRQHGGHLAGPVVRGRVLAQQLRLADAGAVHRAGVRMPACASGCSTG